MRLNSIGQDMEKIDRFVCLEAIVICLVQSLAVIKSAPLAPAIYVFGDSTVDGGNNNYLPTVGRANYAPYGKNFPGANATGFNPTGRFNNGRTIADYIAEFVGLPYPAPYIGRAYFKTVPEGVNFASGTCGILDTTGEIYGTCLSMEEQVEGFGYTVENLQAYMNNTQAVANHLAKSIVLISVGSNDFLQGPMDQLYNQQPLVPDPQQFAQSLINALSAQLKKLYQLGLRKVVVFDVGPLGCVPTVVRTYPKAGIRGLCYEEANEIVRLYNGMLGRLLQDLTASMAGSHFVLGREFDWGYYMIHHPAQSGFMDTVNPCCKALFNGTVSLCIPWVEPCAQPDKYFFWDAVHYTDKIGRMLAAGCFESSKTCHPPIRDLVRL